MTGSGRILGDINQLRQAVTEFGSDFIRGIRQQVPQAPGQLRIPFTSPRAPGGKFQSPYGPRISPADVDARRAIQERQSVVDVMRDDELRRNLPVNLGPSRKTPGQLSIPRNPPRPPSPAPQQLPNIDPGTYKSIQDIARRASDYYKTPISAEDLMSPRGLGILDDIEASMGRGLPSSPGALMNRTPGGALTRSPAGELTEYQRSAFSQMPGSSPRGYSMDDIIDVPVADYPRRALNPASQTDARGFSTDDFIKEYQNRDFSQMPEPSARGSLMDDVIGLPSEVRNVAGGLRTVDLRKPILNIRRAASNPATDARGYSGYSTDDFIKEYQRRALNQMPEPSARGSLMDDVINLPAEVRNVAGGLRTVDLRKLAGLGLLGTLVGGGLLSRMNRPSGPQDNLDQEGIGEPAPQGTPPPPVIVPPTPPGTLPPTGRADDPLIDYGDSTLPGQIGAGTVTIRRYGGRDEALNAALQNAGLPSGRTKPQEDLLAYYQQREVYAANQANKNKIMSELASLDPRYSSPDIQAWANANPDLAYELINKTKRSQSLVNQQMPQREKIATPITQMGSDTSKNAVGNARMAGILSSLNDQGAYDLENATTPYYPMEISNPGALYR